MATRVVCPANCRQSGSNAKHKHWWTANFRFACHSGTIRKVDIQASRAVQRDEKIASFFKFFSKGRAS